MDWFQLGIHLGIPHYRLSIIKADNQNVEKCKVAMLQWWLENSVKAKWSTIVWALFKAGKRGLANKIALDHGMVNVTLYTWHSANLISLLTGVPSADYSNVSEAAAIVEPPANMVCSFTAKCV